MAATDLARWQAIFDAAPFVAHLGLRVDEAEPGAVQTSLVIQPHHLQHTGSNGRRATLNIPCDRRSTSC